MNLLNTLCLLVAALVASCSAQACSGGVRIPSCSGPPDIGRLGWTCTARTLWYYDPRSRQCRELRYRGCRGNNNRHCSRAECLRRCRR